MGRVKDTMIGSCELLDDIKKELDNTGDIEPCEGICIYNRYLGALMMSDELTGNLPIRINEDGYHEYRFDLPREANVYWDSELQRRCYRTEES